MPNPVEPRPDVASEAAPLNLAGSSPSKAHQTDIDLRTALRGQSPNLKEAAAYSPEWARIIWPITRILLSLIAVVMLLPFFVVMFAENDKAEIALDWAKTVLPPVVGFGGALVGYYFGTRGTQQGPVSDESPDEE